MGITKVRLTKADIVAAVRAENYGDSDLSNIANLSGSGLIERKSEGVIEAVPVTDYIKTLLNDATASEARSTLSLGSMATASTSSYLPLEGGTLTGGLIATSFSGIGTSLTALNATNISTGTLSANRLPDSYLPLAGGTTVLDMNVQGIRNVSFLLLSNSSPNGNDGRIAANTYVNNSLNIVGVGTQSDGSDRSVDFLTTKTVFSDAAKIFNGGGGTAYYANSLNNKSTVLSGGSAWATTGAVISLYGVDQGGTNAGGGIYFSGASGARRSATFANLNVTFDGTVGVADVLNVTSTSPSTSPTTGASRVAGGQGVQGSQYVGGNTSSSSFSLANSCFSVTNVGGTTNLSLGTTAVSAYSASAIEIPTNTNYTGIYDGHTGVRLTSGGMDDWGGAQFQVSVSSGWKTYNATPCFAVTNGSARISNGYLNSFATYSSHGIEIGHGSDYSFFDFHSNGVNSLTDYEARLYCLGYTGASGGGKLRLHAKTLELDAFTSLGGDANHPAIKIKVLQGTTSSEQGGTVSIAHNLSAIKIISCIVVVSHNGTVGSYISNSNQFGAGNQFDWSSDDTFINVANRTANSIGILSKPFVATIFYKE